MTIREKTVALIDALKATCKTYGMGNDGNEYKIITEVFLYKFLNDKFGYAIKNSNNKYAEKIRTAEKWEVAYSELSDMERKMLWASLSPDLPRLKPEHLIANLWNQQAKGDFDFIFDNTMSDIAEQNLAIYSTQTTQNTKIPLFEPLTQYVTDVAQRAPFARAMVDKLANFSFEEAFSEHYDFFANIFEYLIKDYNKDSGSYGEYFTPHAIANIMARILAPQGDSNVTIYDPAAGSGTLVLALAHQVGEGNCTVYTQDRSQKSNEFMRLNLILNGQVNSLANVVHDDTLVSPRHLSYDGKSLKTFDYIVSNPPFKADFSASRDLLASEKYGKRFWAGVPKVPAKQPEKMAIYLMFLQHIIDSMKPDAKAAIVVPTGFLTAKSKIESKIRQNMVDSGMLRGVISMPSNIFANTGTNVSIIFLDRSKQYDNALLMDASKLGAKEKIGKNQRTVLSSEEIKRIISTFNASEEQDDFSVIADYDAIKEKRYSFSAGQYFEVKIEYVDFTPEQFHDEVTKRMSSLHDLWSEGDRLQHDIEDQMKAVHFA